MQQDDRKLKQLTESVTEILYHYDPVGMVDYSLPKDEYSIEAGNIVSRLDEVTDLRSLRWMVYDVLVFWFSENMILANSNKCYRYIAEEIWEDWQIIIDGKSLKRRSDDI